ncbi:carboxypeptidase-like regulatory domain-containing protein [Mucilaginibacter corticis]|uniref:Carboxypeptidase-like regulatory domain-containing protein n=1 Tax=Mucilaginibacter corticis TaxID=2597670 RepID=A0A556MWA1_9SPHI|nr:carboxypeptidase-like regulatory domain-containing protein [Mucilaginibacter corticis]TSJ44143.1 carboxypeptidase-like regulatory domain-containing protein [Mucilaginibacter corticis]
MRYLLFIVAVFLGSKSFAQSGYSVSGSVVDENNRPLNNATVFMSGSQKITITNDSGKFILSRLNTGSYQMVIKLMGYTPFSQNIMVRQNITNFKVSLKINPYQINEVIIGGDRDRPGKYDLFKDNFLGTTKNGSQCKILNPEIINLKNNRKNGTLEATTNDFLIIENKQLGYRIRYLLKAFEYHYNNRITNYYGETSFEEMDGLDKLKKEWKKNRLKAYKGSLMHFLRSVYEGKDTPVKEGFFVRQIYDEIGDGNQGRLTLFTIGVGPVKFDNLVSVIDTSFVALKFNRGLYITYDPHIAFKVKFTGNYNNTDKIQVKFSYDASVLQLHLNDAVIDSRGSFTNYRAFFIRGELGEKRVGDQLPFEYQPD